MSRILYSLKNISAIWLGQVVSVLCTFAVRMVFVRYLSQDYLGLETLFSNVLTILSLAELGVGSAIVYSLYEPLARKDHETIKSIMRLFRRAYVSIGILIAITGCLLTPNIEILINETPDIPMLRLYFLFFVFNTSISYFFSYKGSLITADQKNYVVALIRYAFQIILCILQSIVLVVSGSYLLFLSCMLLCTLMQNIFTSIAADRLYPFLKEKDVQPINDSVLTVIKKNLAGMVIHKTSSIANAPVNTVMLSLFTNLSMVAMYGNYILIINALAKIVDQMFDSIVSSIGNLGITESTKRQHEVFRITHFVNAFLFGSLTVSLLPLIGPFVEFAFGNNYVFPIHIAVLFAIWFYVRGMRDAVLSFISAYGLFWQTRIKALAEALVLITACTLLTPTYGIEGLLIANIFVQVFISLLAEAYALHKYGFKLSPLPYYLNVLKYSLVTIALTMLSFAIVSTITGAPLVRFFAGGLVSVVVGFGGFTLLSWRSSEFGFIKNTAKSLAVTVLDKREPKR